jgi:transposase
MQFHAGPVDGRMTAYFGLTPRRYQSGERDVSGHISEVGDVAMRSALYEAAVTLIRPSTRYSFPQPRAAASRRHRYIRHTQPSTDRARFFKVVPVKTHTAATSGAC